MYDNYTIQKYIKKINIIYVQIFHASLPKLPNVYDAVLNVCSNFVTYGWIRCFSPHFLLAKLPLLDYYRTTAIIP